MKKKVMKKKVQMPLKVELVPISVTDQKLPQMNGMAQVIMMVPTQDELNDAADQKRTEYPSQNNIIENPLVGTVIPPNTAMAANDIIRLSKNKKLRMAHQGFIEVEQTWKSSDSYEEIMSGSSTVWRFNAKGLENTDNGDLEIAGSGRPLIPIAKTDDGIVVTNPGTFTAVDGYKTKDFNGNLIEPFEDNIYDGNPSSSSANDGLVGPDDVALAADQILQRQTILDEPGKANGSAMTSDNYLSLPGDPITTSTTSKYLSDTAIAAIEAMRQAHDASSLTIQMILNVGVPPNSVETVFLSDYKSALASWPTAIATIVDVQTIVRSVMI